MRSILLLPMLACASAPLLAQVTSLDEGSFVIMRAGERVGREDFSIRSAPAAGGQVLVAHAVVAIASQRIEPSLNADTSGAVLKYQTEIRENGRTTLTYSGELMRDHYRARSSRPDGESAREFRLPRGTVAAEGSVVSQLWFIVRRGAGATVHVLAPLRNTVETVRVELIGPERLTIDSREFQTQHFRLVTAGTGAVTDVWVDPAGHLLKVAIPATKLVALRDEGPR